MNEDTPEQNQTPQTPSNSKVWLSLAAIIIIGAIVYLGWVRKNEKPAEQPAQIEDEYSGWNTFVNEKYKYQIKYPSEAVVTRADKNVFSLTAENRAKGFTVSKLYETYTGEVCVGIQYKLGYIYISAPDNKEFGIATCGRTSAAYEQLAKEEKLTVDGQEYLSRGFEEKGPGEALSYHNETMIINLNDGTRIEYGSVVAKGATYADYLAMREELLRIITSYKKI